jgi:flagellar motor switch protein FliN/FliY
MGLDDLDNLDNLDDFFPEQDTEAEGSSSATKSRELEFFRHIPVKVTLEVASTELPLGDLMQLQEGAVIKLDKQSGEALDIRVNGKLMAKGEVVVINGNYGLRIISLHDEESLRKLETA